jgi:hypothetical protein
MVAVAATLFKYYPATLFILAVKERITPFLIVSGLVLLIGAVFVFAYFEELRQGLPLIPAGSYFSDMFGAKNLPFGAAQLAQSAGLANVVIKTIAPTIYVLLIATAAVACWRLVRRPDFNEAVSALPELDSNLLVIGCALLTGCFFFAQNYGYRGIFFCLFCLAFSLWPARWTRRAISRMVNGPAPVMVRSFAPTSPAAWLNNDSDTE